MALANFGVIVLAECAPALMASARAVAEEGPEDGVCSRPRRRALPFRRPAACVAIDAPIPTAEYSRRFVGPGGASAGRRRLTRAQIKVNVHRQKMANFTRGDQAAASVRSARAAALRRRGGRTRLSTATRKLH